MSTPTSPSLRWVQKRLGVQQWQDVRTSGNAVPLWFPACRVGQPTVSHHAGDVFCAFPSLFCRPSTSLRPIQSLTSGRGRSSRPIDRGELVLRVSCRKSCRNLKGGERFTMATKEEKDRLCRRPGYQQKVADRYSQHNQQRNGDPQAAGAAAFFLPLQNRIPPHRRENLGISGYR